MERKMTTRYLAVGLLAAWLAGGCGGGSDSAPKTRPSARPSGSGAAASKSDSKLGRTGEGWGDLVGRFVLDGTAPQPGAVQVTKDPEFCGKHNLHDESLLVSDDGGIANVLIYVRTSRQVQPPVHPEVEQAAAETPVLDNKNCRFEPHVGTVWLDKQSLLVKNSDPIAHNTNIAPPGDSAINPILSANGQEQLTFTVRQSNPVPVTCNIHPWMKAYVLPLNTPYAAVSGADGSFRIPKLPTGTWEFQVWHETAGNVQREGWDRGRFVMEIKEGDNDLGTIQLPVSLFE